MQTQQRWSWSPKVCSENPQAHTTLFLYQCQFVDMADIIPKPSFIKWLIHQWAFLTLENPNKCLCKNHSSREQSLVGQPPPALPQQTQQAGHWMFIGGFFSLPVLVFNANKISRGAGAQTPPNWKVWPFPAPLPCCSTSAEGAGPEHWIFCISFLQLSLGQQHLLKSPRCAQVSFPLPHPAARPSPCPVIYTDSKEVSSAPKLQRCYSPKGQDRKYSFEVGKFTCWA